MLKKFYVLTYCDGDYSYYTLSIDVDPNITSYHGRDFIYEFIDGYRDIYLVRKNFRQGKLYNALCWSTQDLLYNTGTEFHYGDMCNFFSGIIYTHELKSRKVYEYIYNEEFLDTKDPQEIRNILKELLDSEMARVKLEEEIRSMVK